MDEKRKKNIIYFRGSDIYSIREALEKWKTRFRETQNSTNIDTYRIDEIRDWRGISSEMMTLGLFAEKRLFVISGGKSTAGKGKKSVSDTTPDTILTPILDELPEDHFIIFYAVGVGEGGLIKYLEKHADIRDFNDPYKTALWEKRFPELNFNTIENVITRYRETESIREGGMRSDISDLIFMTLRKLALLDTPTPSDIESSLDISAGAKIFDLVDQVLRGEAKKAMTSFHTIIETSNSFAFLPLFIGAMRNSVYTLALKKTGYPEKEIAKELSIHPYALSKSYRITTPYEKIQKFYHKLLDINTSYRSGKGHKDPELGRIFEIELAILGLQKDTFAYNDRT